jgi:hypothetical protein
MSCTENSLGPSLSGKADGMVGFWLLDEFSAHPRV